jgi:putative oxidoreductase
MNFLRIDLPARFQDYGLLFLRLTVGYFMVYGHGFGKVTRLLGSEEIKFADPYGLGPAISLGLAAFAEFLCSLLIMAGLFTRLALIPLIFTMFTVVFVVNLGKEFGDLEKALLFGSVFIALFFTGPGKFSLDALLWKNK